MSAKIKYNKIKNYYILFILIISLNNYSCSIDFTKNDSKIISIYGKVEKKYRDEKNHGEPTLIYINGVTKYKYQVSDWAINSDFWEYIEVGDTIKKKSGSLTFRIIKNNGNFKDYDYQR